jgi:hypothetical protein
MDGKLILFLKTLMGTAASRCHHLEQGVEKFSLTNMPPYISWHKPLKNLL